MTETAAPASFLVILCTKGHGGYENECFTHHAHGNWGPLLPTRTDGPVGRVMVCEEDEWTAQLANQEGPHWIRCGPQCCTSTPG